jgi:hypothetical protein
MPQINIQFTDRLIVRERDSRHIPYTKIAGLITDAVSGNMVELLFSKHSTLLDKRLGKYREAVESGDYRIEVSENIYTC